MNRFPGIYLYHIIFMYEIKQCEFDYFKTNGYQKKQTTLDIRITSTRIWKYRKFPRHGKVDRIALLLAKMHARNLAVSPAYLRLLESFIWAFHSRPCQ